MLEIYMLLALSANQVICQSGLLSLGQAVYYGVGAYAAAITITTLGLSYWESLLAVALACFLTAMLFSLIAGRLRELYFSLAMLALQIIFFWVAYNWMNFVCAMTSESGHVRCEGKVIHLGDRTATAEGRIVDDFMLTARLPTSSCVLKGTRVNRRARFCCRKC